MYSLLTNSNNPTKSVTIPWNKPKGSWQRIHIDFLGPVSNTYFLIVLDAYSKYSEIFKMNKITTEETILKLRETFARWDIPEHLVSDNGPQLTSHEFKRFLASNGIKHSTSAPYHPASNGAAENAVTTFKKSLRAALIDPKSKTTPTKVIISRYLMNYRNSTHCTTNEAPSVLMLGRRVKTLFDLLKPRNDKSNTGTILERRMENFKESQKVMIKDYKDKNHPVWIKASIDKVLGEKNYTCKAADGKSYRRHLDQNKKLEGAQEQETGTIQSIQHHQ